MSDYSKLLSVFAKSNTDYYCFSDEDSCGNITNYIVIVQNGIMLTYEFITYLEWEADKSQKFVKMTSENVEFKNLGEYIVYRYNLEIQEKIPETSDFCDVE